RRGRRPRRTAERRASGCVRDGRPGRPSIARRRPVPLRNPCRTWAERPTLSGWHGSSPLLDPALPGSTAETPAGGGAAGNGRQSTFRAATPQRQTMNPETSGSGSEPPGKERRPVTGLRLEALPPCADPAFPVLHDYFEMVYGPLIGPASTLLA